MTDHGDSRTRLLDTTTRLLSRHGYSGTAIKEVLLESGVVAGSLYHHFPGGKEELAAAAVARSGEWAQAVFTSLFAERGAAGAVDAYFRATVDRLVASDYVDGCPIGTPAADAPAGAAAVQEAAGAAFAGWTKTMVDHLVRHEGWGRPAAREVAANIVSLYEGSILVARVERSMRPVQAAARLSRSLIDAGPPTP